ncbi:MAG: MbnP family protein [Bacteroidota bacterium]
MANQASDNQNLQIVYLTDPAFILPNHLKAWLNDGIYKRAIALIPIYLGLVLLSSLNAKAQGLETVSLQIMPVFGNTIIKTGDETITKVRLESGTKDSLAISNFRFYISGTRLMLNNETIWAEAGIGSYHLADASKPASLQIPLNIPKGIAYNRIAFNLGIDSLTNAGGAKGGSLDAANGMYWAWHSGYINMILEGSSPLCKTRKHGFQYHLGGFRQGEYCMQKIVLPVNNKAATIQIKADASVFINREMLVNEANSMTPGKRVTELSKKAAGMFSVGN